MQNRDPFNSHHVSSSSTYIHIYDPNCGLLVMEKTGNDGVQRRRPMLKIVDIVTELFYSGLIYSATKSKAKVHTFSALSSAKGLSRLNYLLLHQNHVRNGRNSSKFR
jgi:hypothetical protein